MTRQAIRFDISTLHHYRYDVLAKFRFVPDKIMQAAKNRIAAKKNARPGMTRNKR
jgi:hypothetical protein